MEEDWEGDEEEAEKDATSAYHSSQGLGYLLSVVKVGVQNPYGNSDESDRDHSFIPILPTVTWKEGKF